MLQNVEYTSIPDKFIYESKNGTAHLTLMDNIREGVNAQNEPCWLCDVYFMELPDSPNMKSRVERAFDKFLEQAKRKDAEAKQKQNAPDPMERIAELESMLEAMTVRFAQLSDSVQEAVKKDDSEMPRGDYLNPIPYEPGMNVFSELFYTDGENIWEALVSGIPSGFDDRGYFDIIG